MVVERIKIYDNKYPVKFGNGAIKRYCQAKGIDNYSDFFQQVKTWGVVSPNSVDDMALLLKCAIDSGAALTGEEIEEIKTDIIVEWWGDERSSINQFMDLLMKSMPSASEEDKKQSKKKAGVKS